MVETLKSFLRSSRRVFEANERTKRKVGKDEDSVNGSLWYPAWYVDDRKGIDEDEDEGGGGEMIARVFLTQKARKPTL